MTIKKSLKNAMADTFYIHKAQMLTPEFRSATFWNPLEQDDGLVLSGVLDNIKEGGKSSSKEKSDGSAAQTTISFSVIAPFTSGTITAYICKHVENHIPCTWSVVFDPLEFSQDGYSAKSWVSTGCLLILGHDQPVTEDVFEDIKNYLKAGGRVVYWGNIAPDANSQYELIGARQKGTLDNVADSFVYPTDSSSKRAGSLTSGLINGVREFKPIGKLSIYSSLDSSCHSLLTGKAGKVATPVAWVKNFGKGKLFYSSLSEESDWLCDDCMTLMLNSISWAAKRD